jgi:hypothetical protein
LARIILSHALLESIRFVMSRKERRDIYGLINSKGERIACQFGLPRSGLAEHVDPGRYPATPRGECHGGAIEQSGSLPERGGQIPRIG